MSPFSGLIELSFDPLVQLGSLALRWQTIGMTVALLLALAIAARNAARPPLRLADLVLIVVAIVPGAILLGRGVHAVAYLEYYSARPLALIDPNVGSLSLLGAVMGGCIGAAYVARSVGNDVVRWADLAAAPMLITIGLGKLAQLLGGSGQGLPFDGPWAVAFSGPGPWVDANPDLASHPAQVYEGLWLLIGLPILALLGRRKPLGSGWMFALGMCWFLVGRLLVGFTWRDTPVIGPLNVEQALAGALLLGAAVAALRAGTRPRDRTPLSETGPFERPTGGEGVS